MASLYEDECFVVLRPGQDETFMTREEVEALLAEAVAAAEGLSGAALAAQVHHLFDTACEYPTRPGEYLRWFGTRLSK